MKIIFILFFILMIISPIGSIELDISSEIYNPQSITVDESHIYITQDIEVFIYSKRDFKLKTKFGKAGEGPREFLKTPAPYFPAISLYLKDNQLMINSIGKISFYSKQGEFIEETRTKGIARYIPVGDNYIYVHITNEDKITYISTDLADVNLNKISVVSRFKFPAQSGKKRNPILLARMASYFDRYTHKDKLVYITEDNIIKIFNDNGKEVTSFIPEYTKVPINQEMKKKLDEFFIKDIRYKEPYLIDKSRGLIALPEYLPAFKNYRLADDKIYIFSNYKKEDKLETFIYDFSGKLLEKTFLPLVEQDMLNLFPFNIKDNKIYQLIWDEDEEQCKLRITKI